MKKFRIFFIFVCTLVCSFIIGGFTYAWVADNGLVSKITATSKIQKTYFNGSGTSDDPYLIEMPAQLYYLSWLQGLGYFEDNQFFFKVTTDLDMSEYTLPSIGTVEYPFISNFNGNGKIISNLNISNNKDDLTDNAESESEKIGDVEIIGLFGVVGSISEEASYDTSICAIHDFFVNNVTINTQTSNTLIGIVAGYVNGSVKNVGVIDSSLNITSSAQALSYTGNLSDYSLVGYCTDSYKDKIDIVNISIGEVESKTESSSSGDGDWGESIDLASLAKRINYIAINKNSNTKLSTSDKYKEYNNTTYNANLYYYNRCFNWDDYYVYGEYVTMQSTSSGETYLPLNINLSTATISGSYSGDQGSYYTSGSNTSEPVLSTNTGYIVGNGSLGNATPRLHNKTMNPSGSTDSQKNGITYSLESTDKKTTSISSTDTDGDGIYDVFEENYIAFYYYNCNDNKTYRITDTSNNSTSFSKTSTIDVENCNFSDTKNGYYNVKSNFSKMLSEQNTSKILDSGLINLNGIQLFKLSSSTVDNILTYKQSFSNVTINSSTPYSSYEMLKGGINFELKSSGSLKLILGTYTSGTSYHYFPSLYKVNRSTDNSTIKSAQKITAIYSKTENGKTTYYQQYSDNSATIPSDATKIIDLNYMNSNACLDYQCAYYFEMPLEAGDYFFCNDSTGNAFPYIMYLDLGANGDQGTETTTTTITETFKKVTKTYNVASGVALVENQGDEVNALNSISLVVSTAITGEITISKDGNNITCNNSNVQVGYLGKGLTYNGSTSEGIPISTTEEITHRTTTIDSSGNKTITTIVITKVDGTITSKLQKIDDGEWTTYSGDDITFDDNKVVSTFNYYDNNSSSVNIEYTYDETSKNYNVTITSNNDITVTGKLTNSDYIVKIKDTTLTSDDQDITISKSVE